METASILVVDDVKENLDILVQILHGTYKVKAAPNGMMAVKIAQKTKPDLIFLDIIMPGMDGYQVMKKLKEDPKTSSIPVIFVTANDTNQEKEKGLAMGAAGYLHKPVDPQEILSTVEKILIESQV